MNKLLIFGLLFVSMVFIVGCSNKMIFTQSWQECMDNCYKTQGDKICEENGGIVTDSGNACKFPEEKQGLSIIPNECNRRCS